MSFDMPKVGTWEQRGGWVVRQLVADIGLSVEQAAGVVGNLGYESKGFTDLQEIAPTVAGSRGGYGWAQWTGSRRVKFEAWCAAHNLAPASDEANYGFLVEDLTGGYRSFTASLKRCAGIEDACRLTHKLYETPSDVLDGSYRSGPDRLHWAQRALAGAATPTQQPPAPTQQPDPPTQRLPAADPIIAGLKSVQTQLAAAGFYKGAIDGIFGPKTMAAIAAYCEARGV